MSLKLTDLPFSARSDEKIMMKFIEEDPLLITEMPLLQGNKNIVKKACKSNMRALPYASYYLRDNCDFMLEMVSFNDLVILYASERLRTDLEFAKEVLKKYRCLFRFPECIRKDKECVEIALRLYSSQIEHAHSSLFDDKDIIRLAIGDMIRLKIDLSINAFESFAFISLMQNNHKLYELVPESLKSSKEYLDSLIAWAPSLVITLAPTVEVACRIVKSNPLYYKDLPNDLKANTDVIAAAIGV